MSNKLKGIKTETTVRYLLDHCVVKEGAAAEFSVVRYEYIEGQWQRFIDDEKVTGIVTRVFYDFFYIKPTDPSLNERLATAEMIAEGLVTIL